MAAFALALASIAFIWSIIATTLAWRTSRQVDLTALIRRLDALETLPSLAIDPDAIDAEIHNLRADMLSAVDEVTQELEHVERVERRIRGTVNRARKELAQFGIQHPGLEAEATQLQLVDGGGGPGGGVRPVPEGVADDQESSIPGVTREQLRAVRGF